MLYLTKKEKKRKICQPQNPLPSAVDLPVELSNRSQHQTGSITVHGNGMVNLSQSLRRILLLYVIPLTCDCMCAERASRAAPHQYDRDRDLAACAASVLYYCFEFSGTKPVCTNSNWWWKMPGRPSSFPSLNSVWAWVYRRLIVTDNHLLPGSWSKKTNSLTVRKGVPIIFFFPR